MAGRQAGRRRPALLAMVLCLSSALAALEACDFGARNPQDPVTEERLVSLTDPDSVRRQIRIGLETGIITQYLNAFADNFAFHPDERDSTILVNQTGDPTLFDDWDRNVERQVMQLVFGQSSVRTVAFANQDSLPGADPAVVVLFEDYDLQIDSDLYEGTAELQLRRAGDEWRIFLWIDRHLQDSDQPSWTVLKGMNR